MKNHTPMRMALIAIFFVVGLALVIGGWALSGVMAGLLIQLLGTVLLLTALFVYNAAYKEPRHRPVQKK
ncbi:MAG: hypothetical protein MR006_02470 [Arcanobacterium sp.]|nr:hypothetical protein [Arcanobacterium sp.]MDY5588372.1 hypothetical protein [Arcanobacterium sp.]